MGTQTHTETKLSACWLTSQMSQVKAESPESLLVSHAGAGTKGLALYFGVFPGTPAGARLEMEQQT